jgi:hypothetical protein
MAKARQFADAAALFYDDTTGSADLPDAYVTTAVHSGIAAADVVCIRRLGAYQASGAHQEAVALLKRADADASKHLSRLLSLKSKAGYSANPASRADVDAARRAHLALLEAAESA